MSRHHFLAALVRKRKNPTDEMFIHDDQANRKSSKRLLCPEHSTETTEKTTRAEGAINLRQ